MAKVSLDHIDKAASADPFPNEFKTTTPGVETRRLVPGARASIEVLWHRLAADQVMGWDGATTGCIAYVWAGAVTRSGILLEAGSIVMTEPGAHGTVKAVAAGAELIVFRPQSGQQIASGQAPHVHMLRADAVPRHADISRTGEVGAAIYADADLPGCSLWLHGNSYVPDYEVALHSHGQDEVIVVTEGEIILGNRASGRGTILFVAKDTVYSFKVGKAGMSFINFRPGKPTFKSHDGQHFVDEQKFLQGILGTPPFISELGEGNALVR